MNLGLTLLKLSKYCRRFPDEDTAIPEVVAGSHKLLSLGIFWLLLESQHLRDVATLSRAGVIAAVYVTVAGCREGWLDAKREQSVRKIAGELLRGMNCPPKLLFRFDGVIGRHDNDRGIGIIASDESGSKANAGSGITS